MRHRLTMTRRWPLHPMPDDWEGLETWIRRIAATYGVSYDTFLRHALDRTGRGARNLDLACEKTLERLSAGTGVSLDQLRMRTSGMMMSRMTERIAAWMETEEGRAARDQLMESLRLMSRRVSAGDTEHGGSSTISAQDRLRSID